jgi:hypothetical protein
VRARVLHAECEAQQDDHVPEHRAQRGHGEVVVTVENPDHDPRQPEDEHEREEDPREPGRKHAEFVVRPVAEDPHHPRRNHDKQGRQPSKPEQHEPKERGGHPPGALPLTFDEEVAEDWDERGRERGVGHERPHRVRDEIGDLERIDRAGDAEDGGLRDLADQADDA